MIAFLRRWFRRAPVPAHLEQGRRGEEAARAHLRGLGLRFLAANYAGRHGEVDLVFRDGDCLVFVEVKTRDAGSWTRPAAAVDDAKQRRISRTALEYLAEVGNPRVRFRFDIVEVVTEDGVVASVQHLPNAFPLHRRHTYVAGR